MIDTTHDHRLRSWIESANDGGADFPIQNLPLGVFRRRGADESWRVGCAIGDRVLDLAAVNEHGRFSPLVSRQAHCFGEASLNLLMSLGAAHATAVRADVSALLRADTDSGERARRLRDAITVALADVELALPVECGDYTDFYASIDHAQNVGRMLRPDRPLLPNYKWVPIGYHGRASTLVASGTIVRRPAGQSSADPEGPPVFGPTARLDYEAEVGFLIGKGNRRGEPIAIAEAESHLFGLCLVNDWSARDIQAWEYQPLGPFVSKSFATTVSPWVVTRDALAPFRAPGLRRAGGDPAPMPYLTSEENATSGAIALTVETCLSSARMRKEGRPAERLARGNLASLYWTPAQLIAHHTVTGCSLRPGDLLASGTVSGPTREERGCLLELTWRGSEPIELANGEIRRFLEDGDEVTLRAFAERDGFTRIGFGECRGTVAAADPLTHGV